MQATRMARRTVAVFEVLGLMALGVVPLVLATSTWGERQQLLASDGFWADQFGVSVAVSGEVAVIGSARDDTAGGADAGSAYVFVRDSITGAWSEIQQLLASDGSANDLFGYSVAMSGDVAVIGAYTDDNAGGEDAGAAYLFVRDVITGAWSEAQKLLASDGSANDKFGYSVSVSGEVIVIGAYLNDHAGDADAGAAYVFVRNADSGSWFEDHKLVASGGSMVDWFGYSVAVSGEVAVIGAARDDPSGSSIDAGSAYVFVRDSTTGAWSEIQQLLASDGSANDWFGYSVAVSGDVAVIGAYYDDDEVGGEDAGAAYLFVRDAITGAWSEAQKLLASDVSAADGFGYSVSVSGEVVLIGANRDDNAGGVDAGAAYLFLYDVDSGLWFEAQKLLASDGSGNDRFGKSVAVSGEVAVVGAFWSDTAGGNNAGSAYVLGLCHDFAYVASVETGSCSSCTGLAAAECLAATCAPGFSNYNNAMCCHDFASVESVETDSCTSCIGTEEVDCLEASCAPGFTGFNSGMCIACYDFASVETVVTNSCDSCTGTEAADCLAATCAPGFSNYNGGICCHDFASVESVETGTCTSCTGPEAEDCLEASCAPGFSNFDNAMCCNDFASVESVETGSCSVCNSSEMPDCLEARCAPGFFGYGGGICASCYDFASVVSVETGSCSSCIGSGATDCVEARCASGFSNYDGGMCCDDFASVESVETDSCSSCSGSDPADCLEATCAPGFSNYNNAMCCHDFATIETVVSGTCASCTGPAIEDCMEATCAPGFSNYNNAMCCHDLASVESVLSGTCTACTGPAIEDCLEATCAPGFSLFNNAMCCHDFASVESVETGSCSLCTGPEAADCREARCAPGFFGYEAGICCNDFASVASVETGSCRSCSGPEEADCLMASCAFGFSNYNNAMCCHDFAEIESVVTNSCGSCTGPEAADCPGATCAPGFLNYNGGMCCHDFASVESVETGTCTSCTGPEAEDCLEASCAPGFSGYEDGTCCHGGCWTFVMLLFFSCCALGWIGYCTHERHQRTEKEKGAASTKVNVQNPIFGDPDADDPTK